MTTKYDIKQKVWFFASNGLTEGTITEIVIKNNGVIIYTIKPCMVCKEEHTRVESAVFLTQQDILNYINMRLDEN
jgi:hypothetical protein